MLEGVLGLPPVVDELEGAAQSLSALAVERGLIPANERDRLLAELHQQVAAKTPTSFARLLIREGVAPATVQNLLATGAAFPAVRCDGCGQPIPQGLLPERREYPCPACGAFLLGFSAFLRSPPPKDEEDSEETEKLPVIVPRQVGRFSPSAISSGLGPAPPSGSNVTDRYDQVLPVPAAPPADIGGTTLAFKDVLGGPGAPSPQEAEEAGGRTIEFSQVLTAAPPPPAADAAEEVGGRTIEFSQVLGGPAPPAVERSDGQTKPFDDVFVLPSGRRKLSESQVQDQMSTLLQPGSTFMDLSEEGLVQPFDPEGLTIPTGKTVEQLKAEEAAARAATPPRTPTPPPTANPFASQARPAVTPSSIGAAGPFASQASSQAAEAATMPPPADRTFIVSPPSGALEATIEGRPPAALITPGNEATIPPGYGEEATTVPPDQIYAVQGPKMPGVGVAAPPAPAARRVVGVRGRGGPRVWPWVVALVLLLGAAAAGLYLLLTS